ncbi:uncharacterized protein [Choristoneura fumiferana]|uniref:uncharacterized protein n=1 Tax=Choristoneura fumiferana TaxID=7141 RepID=UPI003D15381A
MEWNKEKTLFFIQLIKERPVIWDVSSSDHKIKNKKQDAIKEIASVFGITAKEVLAKWTSLRGQYNREKKKVTGLKTGSGAEDVYISKWFAYEEISNMICFNIPQNSVSNLQDDMVSTYFFTLIILFNILIPTSINLLGYLVCCLIPSPQSTSSSLLATPTPPPATPTPPPATPTPPPATPTPPPATPPLPAPTALPPPSKFPNKKRNRNTALYSEAMSTLKAIKERQPSSTDLDDVTSFGVYVAAQLKKFRPIEQSKLKLDIQTLFYNCEVANLNHRSTTSTSDYSDYSCELLENPESPMTLNDTEPNTSFYGQSDIHEVQSTINKQPSIQIAGTSVCVQPDLRQSKPMQSSAMLSPSNNALPTYCPLNTVIGLSNDGHLIRESKPSQYNNLEELPAVFIIDNKTIVRPSSSSAQMENTEICDQETTEAIDYLLKFNK